MDLDTADIVITLKKIPFIFITCISTTTTRIGLKMNLKVCCLKNHQIMACFQRIITIFYQFEVTTLGTSQ